MKTTEMQDKIINASLDGITLINGYAGVGKSTVLIKRFERLVSEYSIKDHEIVILVRDSYKKAALEQLVSKIEPECNININSIYEIISAYLHFNDLDLFKNTMNAEEKEIMISQIYNNQDSSFKNHLPIEYVIEEINFIQQTIFNQSKDNFQGLLKKEFQKYALISRKSPLKKVLTYTDKQFIWKIYETFLSTVLSDNLFDEHTFFQSFLRLMTMQDIEDSIAFRHILIDDMEDFTPIQLSIIYKFYNQDQHSHHIMLTHDPLKANINIYDLFNDNKLVKYITSNVTMNKNFRTNQSIFNILKSSIEHNPLFPDKIHYESGSDKVQNTPVLSFYHKVESEKGDQQLEVLLDRLDLLINTYEYRLRDILVVFCDLDQMDEYKEKIEKKEISVNSMHERMLHKDVEGITFASKDELPCIELPIVFVMDANDKLLCQSPVNKVTNLGKNNVDCRAFYKILSIATDHLIINTSKSNPSYLLLPGSIDYRHLRYEIGSRFRLNKNYNIYRKSEIKNWIKEQLKEHYNYGDQSFSTNRIHDLVITTNENQKIGVTILDDKTNLEVKESLNDTSFDFLMYIDEYHYKVYEFVNSSLKRIKDVPINP